MPVVRLTTYKAFSFVRGLFLARHYFPFIPDNPFEGHGVLVIQQDKLILPEDPSKIMTKIVPPEWMDLLDSVTRCKNKKVAQIFPKVTH